MFQLRRPRAGDLEAAFTVASRQTRGGRSLLSLTEGLGGRGLPFAFAHDRLRSCIGSGQRAFLAARSAFLRWDEFDLGWVRVANPEIPVAVGQLVAGEVHAFALWSLNVSRVLETVDTDAQFGFLYSTTAHHAEEGEERFLLEYDEADGSVSYHLEAVARPQHALARLAYPFTRALQHRFARGSHARMRRALEAFEQG